VLTHYRSLEWGPVGQEVELRDDSVSFYHLGQVEREGTSEIVKIDEEVKASGIRCRSRHGRIREVGTTGYLPICSSITGTGQRMQLSTVSGPDDVLRLHRDASKLPRVVIPCEFPFPQCGDRDDPSGIKSLK
jgi:hypothetical protein